MLEYLYLALCLFSVSLPYIVPKRYLSNPKEMLLVMVIIILLVPQLSVWKKLIFSCFSILYAFTNVSLLKKRITLKEFLNEVNNKD